MLYLIYFVNVTVKKQNTVFTNDRHFKKVKIILRGKYTNIGINIWPNFHLLDLL